MTSTRTEADKLYNILIDENSNLELYLKNIYENKLMKLVDILKDDIKEDYYIQRNEVEFRDIFEFKNINYIYDKLKSLELYSNAEEV